MPGNGTENESSSSEEESWEKTCMDVLNKLLFVKNGQWKIPTEGQMKALLPPKVIDDGESTTCLHVIAKGYKVNGYYKADKEILKTVLRYLVGNYEKRIHSQFDENGFKRESPFLIIALKKNSRTVDAFIDYIMECCSNEEFAELLDEQDEQGRNSLHHIFLAPPERKSSNRTRKRRILEMTRNFVEKAKPETIASKDDDGNTPIHYALNYSRCRDQCDEYVEVFKNMVDRGDLFMRKFGHEFNARRESPIQYHNRTKEEEDQRALQVPSSSISWANGVDKPSIDKVIFDNIRSPSIVDGGGTLPNHSIRRINTNHNSSQSDIATVVPSTPEKMLEFLKLQYIRTRGDWKVRDLIYGKCSDASEEQFYFDASLLDTKDGYPTAKEIVDLMDKASLTGGFHNTLSYVKLPVVTHTKVTPTIKKTYGSPRNIENPNLGRTSLLSVFDNLREKGVEKILRLQVDDMDMPPHTDEVIIKALLGDKTQSDWRSRSISIETWDWRKPDLDTDVIRLVAPEVEMVNLYWSGNPIVLKGWGCEDGIPSLYKSGFLKQVTIYASPGIETRKRMDAMLHQFESNLLKLLDGKNILKIKYVMSGLQPGLDSKEEINASSRNMESHPQHNWVDEMDHFMGTLKRSMPDLLSRLNIQEPKRVKVALIDDGVDVLKLEYYGKTVQATGRSYCELNDGSENPWYCSTNGHGTIMANMIARINPWISLHVLKLPMVNTQSGKGGYGFYPQWVAKALEDAVDLNADVIVMSWTLKSRDQSGAQGGYMNDPEDRIKKAIKKARKDNILMFCSASDDITRNSKEYFPYKGADEKDVMFRIGAATPTGQRDPCTEDVDDIDYFFPGNQVPERYNPRMSSEIKLHDGSSVSTALAGGLASLILYCTRTVHSYCKAGDNPYETEIYEERAKALKEVDKMRIAFDNILDPKHFNDRKWAKERYLPVWNMFGKARVEIENAQDVEKLEKLKEMVAKLTYNIIIK